ncbi:MAG: hypothetical protein ATN35_05545 [Epulopiscium sp. Nele67-Bin004]|nr:MAG: hypothetical protein ATN35_05545 [Epulopiscium sp. Nele67-Bin004]
MGKVSNALYMLLLLKNNQKWTRKKLAKELEVNIREITRYKDDLCRAGVEIEETRGRYGGYRLISRDYLLDSTLTPNELTAINQVLELTKHQSFLYAKELEVAVTKILSVHDPEKAPSITLETKANTIKYDYQMEQSKWAIINEAKIYFKKLHIEYSNANNEISTRTIHPYTIYAYKGANYLVAFCENRNEVRQFKFIRIGKMKIIDKHFEVISTFDAKTYLKSSIGVYKDGIIDLKLKIFYPFARNIKETIWVDNQKITDYEEDNYLIFEAQMEGKTEIISWIFGMKDSCIVLEPPSLKEDIIQLYKKCLKNY